MNQKIIIDGKNAILGRLAVYAVKMALLGKEVAVINCNEILISGNPSIIIDEYKIKRQRGGHSQKGPNFPKSPERIVKRRILGMLSYIQERVRAALKRTLCYNDTPAQYSEGKKISLSKNLKTKTISLKDLEREI